MFIDFDKEKNMFYNNIYLSDYDIVIKMPIEEEKSDFIIEDFNLAKYTYLCDYD